MYQNWQIWGMCLNLVKDSLVPCHHVLEFNVQNCLQDHLVSNLKNRGNTSNDKLLTNLSRFNSILKQNCAKYLLQSPDLWARARGIALGTWQLFLDIAVIKSRVYTCSSWNMRQQHSQGRFPWAEDAIDFLEFQLLGSPPVCEAITWDNTIVQLLCASKVNLILEDQQLVETPHSRC